MSQIQTGRFSDLLRRTLGMKGVSTVASELSPEISPVLILESERIEWEFLKNEKLMASVYAVTGAAAQNSTYRLRNPVGSGVLAVISDFTYSAAAAGAVLVERDDDNGDLGTVLPTVSRDTRLPVLNASALIASVGTGTALTGESWWSVRALAETVLGVRGDSFVLTPGHELDIASIALNVNIRGFVHWRERRLDILEER